LKQILTFIYTSVDHVAHERTLTQTKYSSRQHGIKRALEEAVIETVDWIKLLEVQAKLLAVMGDSNENYAM
jgi:hypothetical protein